MINSKNYQVFRKAVQRLIEKEEFILLRLTNRRKKDLEWKLVLVKLVNLKAGPHLSFVYRYETQDVTKNYPIQEGLEKIDQLLVESFYQAELEGTDIFYFLTIFDNDSIKIRQKIKENKSVASLSHDNQKDRMITKVRPYLNPLGITTTSNEVRHKMKDKYKQINKYVEIIHDILKRTKLPENPTIVDMGSGKGYLTFALYDYFMNIRKNKPNIYGVEIRKELVDFCNQLATQLDYNQLQFEGGSIENFNNENIDFLIALHACDTATDDAIFKGLTSKSQLIICAPCCHKQVRKNLNPTSILKEITQHGILKERQAEILTDTIRAKILEAYGYNTRVFEFISTTHTPKNVLIVASLDEYLDVPNPQIIREIKELKSLYGLPYHHLEKLVGWLKQ